MALAAIAAAVWLGLSLVSERLEHDTFRVFLSPDYVFAAQVEDALPRARRARRLQPDANPALIEWGLLNRQSRQREALAVLHELLADEPENAQAWLALTQATRDPRRLAEARRRFRALRPR